MFEILDYHTEETYPRLPEALGHFRDALASYRAGKFDAARAFFQQVLAINPNDKTGRLYVEPCELLAVNPPADWRGVWVMEEK